MPGWDPSMIDLATIIPVYNRPQNVQPLILSWLTSATPGHLYFVCEVADIDQYRECENASRHHRVFTIPVVDAHTWPEKINTAIHTVNAEWYLLAADDVKFHRGWWKATEHHRNPRRKKDRKPGLIGTNDLGNPRVLLQQLVIHPLMSYDYSRLGLYDNPDAGPVNEAYHHWCCDDELLHTALKRDAYAFCEKAVIEHLHPYFGKGEMDDVYAHGEEHSREDVAMWRERAVNVFGLQVA
jgi:hypothetical protein